MNTLTHNEEFPAPPLSSPSNGAGERRRSDRRFGRRRRMVAAVGLVALVAAGWAVIRGGSDGAPKQARSATATAEVVRRDLVQTESLDGTLGYAEASTVSGARSGVLTRLAAEGSVVEQGQILYSVNGYPVVVMYGTYPAYRALTVGAGDGPDIRQLEQNLVDLGFATRRNLTVDEHFDAATAAAVKRWQADLGVAADGVIHPGDIVFAAGPVRVGDAKASVGSQVPPGGPVVAVTSTERVVTVDLKATKSNLVAVGQSVTVVLPDGKKVLGTVASIGSVATVKGNDANADPTVEVRISLAGDAGVTALDQAPVDVEVAKSTAKGVLAVPVTALLALAEGGYAVEVRDGAGTRLVPVTVGSYADGYAQVSGSGLAPGTKVVTPS